MQGALHRTQKRLPAPTQCASLLHWLPSASTLLLLANHLLPDIWHSLGFSSEIQHIPTFRRCDMSAGVWFNLTDNMQKLILIHDNPTIVCFGAVRLTYLASNVIHNLAIHSLPSIQHPVATRYLTLLIYTPIYFGIKRPAYPGCGGPSGSQSHICLEVILDYNDLIFFL